MKHFSVTSWAIMQFCMALDLLFPYNRAHWYMIAIIVLIPVAWGFFTRKVLHFDLP